jgi:hypothetical protein
VTKDRLKALLAKYGRVAIGTYFVIFLLVFVGFAIAISTGIRPDSSLGKTGILIAAYLATKGTQPLRIAGTLLLTPLVESGLRRITAARGSAR